MVPAYGRCGVKPIGVFQTQIGPDNPSFLVVASFPSMGAIQETQAKLGGDGKWMKELGALSTISGSWHTTRREAALLRGFRTFPGIEVPKVAEGKSQSFRAPGL